MLKAGDTAPDFTLPDQDGKARTLSSYRGHWVLIYFYPKDDTPGCTKEACMLRDSFPRFEGVHADVFGISADPVTSHKKFADEYRLPFPLLADTEKKVIEAYGVWGEKQMTPVRPGHPGGGRTYMGIRRTSFLIDPSGAIKKIYEKVKPESMPSKSSKTSPPSERSRRARRIVAYLKRAYPHPQSELIYKTPFQFVVAVMLSAQCTDKVVNRVTAELFKRYKTPKDFASAKSAAFQKSISSIPFFRNKTKAIIGSAKKFKRLGYEELIALPGIGYKTAHVIRGELLGEYDGIPTDTHVKRFAKRFDLTNNTDLKKISKDLEALIPRKDWKYVNNGLVLYGRYVCPARPHDCSKHPLTKIWPPALHRWPRT